MILDFGYDTRHAQAAVAVAQRRGLPVPDPIPTTMAMVDVVMRAAHMKPPERPTVDDLPQTTAELAALIEERARAHRVAASYREVAQDFIEPLARRLNGQVAAQVASWIAMLCPEFDRLVKQLRSLSKKLPDQLDAHLINWGDPEVSAPWARAEGIAMQLDGIVGDRQTLARASGLQGEGGPNAELYAVAALPKPTTTDVVQHRLRTHISPELQRWKELRHDPVRRWLHLVRSEHLTIQLATPNEVRERAAVRELWLEAIAVRGVAPVPGAKAIRAIEQVLQAA